MTTAREAAEANEIAAKQSRASAEVQRETALQVKATGDETLVALLLRRAHCLDLVATATDDIAQHFRTIERTQQ
jgi:hypothetical protein